MAAERENDTNTHREGGRERHIQNTERGRDRETLRRTNPLPPTLNPPTHTHLFSPDAVVVLIVVAIVVGVVVETVPAMGGGNAAHNVDDQSLNTANSNNPLPRTHMHTQNTQRDRER